jgi:hypothetical protein
MLKINITYSKKIDAYNFFIIIGRMKIAHLVLMVWPTRAGCALELAKINGRTDGRSKAAHASLIPKREDLKGYSERAPHYALFLRSALEA